MPLPETPVMQTNFLSGNSALRFLRLFAVAPIILMLSVVFFLLCGISIFLRLERYSKVIDLFAFGNSPFKNFSVSPVSLSSWRSGPLTTISPPYFPASGPMSTKKSEAKIVSSSCSTTMTLLPRSLSAFKVLINLSVSLSCKPIVGSSKT